MYVKDSTDVALDELVPPPPGPWDDCFTNIVRWPKLTWPGALELTIESNCSELVVFDQLDHAICVEPQTAPPDALNFRPTVVEPGRPLIAETTWSWQLL